MVSYKKYPTVFILFHSRSTEDLELEMAGYINEMASVLRDAGGELPEGLDQQPYFGQQFQDDAPTVKDYRRRLRATATQTTATVTPRGPAITSDTPLQTTGAYREFLLASATAGAPLAMGVP